MNRSLHFTLAVVVLASAAWGQRNRITGPVDNGRRAQLTGHVHPQAVAENEVGAVDPSQTLPSLTMVLKGSSQQEAALDKFLSEQQDPSSPNYHHWLTPEQFADQFGRNQSDIEKITAWLKQQNLRVTAVARGRNAISFTGTAGDVGRAFQTEFHRYSVRGEKHFANSTEPSIPLPFAVAVRSIKGLNDFRLKPQLHQLDTTPNPDYTSAVSGNHYLAPGDFATIYNVKPLYTAGYDGAGQKIAVAGQTQVDLSDIQLFRSRFQLPDNTPDTLLVPNTQDPGTVSGDMQEADLDLEWAGAVAPKAKLVYVYSYDVMDAVQYAIDQNIAPVLTVSYGNCETVTAPSDALAMQSWARQGNAQGITWFDAAGDSGGADCYDGRSSRNAGFSVDIPASIPEVTGIGGTTLTEASGQYWTANQADGSSALTYIPELVWNDSGPSDPAAGGGGASVLFAKPSWQRGSGVFSDTGRNVPDVALASSAQHNGYMVYNRGRVLVFGGTSAATPSFAAIIALLNQYLVATGAQAAPGVGNINPRLYTMAQTTPSAFHDVTTGNNIVSITCTGRYRSCSGVGGSYGYNAGPGYDQASGLGSVDAFNLVLGWNK